MAVTTKWHSICHTDRVDYLEDKTYVLVSRCYHMEQGVGKRQTEHWSHLPKVGYTVIFKGQTIKKISATQQDWTVTYVLCKTKCIRSVTPDVKKYIH